MDNVLTFKSTWSWYMLSCETWNHFSVTGEERNVLFTVRECDSGEVLLWVWGFIFVTALSFVAEDVISGHQLIHISWNCWLCSLSISPLERFSSESSCNSRVRGSHLLVSASSLLVAGRGWTLKSWHLAEAEGNSLNASARASLIVLHLKMWPVLRIDLIPKSDLRNSLYIYRFRWVHNENKISY